MLWASLGWTQKRARWKRELLPEAPFTLAHSARDPTPPRPAASPEGPGHPASAALRGWGELQASTQEGLCLGYRRHD